MYVCFIWFIWWHSPEAAVDDEKDGDEEGGHLAGVDEGVRPTQRGERRTSMSAKKAIREQNKCFIS